MGARTAVRAAVLNAAGTLDFETLHIDEPHPDEVRVRPVAVGLCHSDLHYVDGTHTTDLPEVLGHEAAGIVESAGSNVTEVRPGDHVVSSLTMFCGTCRYCVQGRMSLCQNRSRLRTRPRPALINEQGTAVGTMGGIGAFAEMFLIHRNGVVPVPQDLPLDVASLFGCAVLTGIGAVTRRARIPAGASVAVVGCGGIGLAVIQGAKLAGASRIIAIDQVEDKLAAAVRFGATDTVISDQDTTAEVKQMLPGGVDYSFEAIGRQATAELAVELLAPGGVATILGMVPDATPVRIPASALYFEEKTVTGAFIGSSRFTVDIPELTGLYQRGRLMLDEMITHRFPLRELNTAMKTLASGQPLRIVIDMSAPA
jgi:S-(hydroxymethyl)glutathione dehydrogenase / alcohol dehydrogenase